MATTSETLALIPAYTHVDHRLADALRRAGIRTLPFHECSDLPKARSQLLTAGLDQTEARVFLLLDSDMTPAPEQLVQLLEGPGLSESGAVSAAYVTRSGGLACRPLTPAPFLVGTPGRLELDAAGLGCMAVHRASLERVAATLPRLTPQRWQPFCVPFYEEGRYYGDDYSLCARLRRTGTRLWLDTGVIVPHLIREPRVALPGRVTPNEGDLDG